MRAVVGKPHICMREGYWRVSRWTRGSQGLFYHAYAFINQKNYKIEAGVANWETPAHSASSATTPYPQPYSHPARLAQPQPFSSAGPSEEEGPQPGDGLVSNEYGLVSQSIGLTSEDRAIIALDANRERIAVRIKRLSKENVNFIKQWMEEQ